MGEKYKCKTYWEIKPTYGTVFKSTGDLSISKWIEIALTFLITRGVGY